MMTFKIEIKQEVYDLFESHYPHCKTRKALDHYASELEKMLFTSLIYRDAFDFNINTYPISTHQLDNRGGRISSNGKKIYVGSWLRDNAPVYLIPPDCKGTIFKKQISKIKLTNNVILTDNYSNLTSINLRSETIQALNSSTINDLAITDILPKEFDRLLAENDVDRILAILYPEITDDTTEDEFKKLFDTIPVNVRSLEAYIYWLLNEAKNISRLSKQKSLREARIILTIAKYTEGKFIQRKNPSLFGRNYYKGISCQSINKTLRRAVLGDAHEYDLKSSAITWKMTYAICYVEEFCSGRKVSDVFYWTELFLADKNACIAKIVSDVYDASSITPEFKWTTKIKQALLAISFGAKANNNIRYFDKTGRETHGAISDIIDEQGVRTKFFDNPFVKGFIAEQCQLDKFIFDKTKLLNPDIQNLAHLKTNGGRLSMSKVIAWQYQTYETKIMQIARKIAVSRGYSVIANIHDAIIFRQKLSFDTLEDINYAIRDATGNHRYAFDHKILKGFNPKIPEEVVLEELAHKQRIIEETKRAEEYYSIQKSSLVSRTDDINISPSLEELWLDFCERWEREMMYFF